MDRPLWIVPLRDSCDEGHGFPLPRGLKGELNEQSVLLDSPLLSFLSENVADNHFIKLTNGAERAKAELSHELMVPYALDEDRHMHLSEEA
ncbi:hypothetical protein ACLOJK_025554 [Asimina triloba]